MRYVRLLQWARPSLPTSQPRKTWLTCSPRSCMDRLEDFSQAGCSGMCSPDRMPLSKWPGRVRLMTDPPHPCIADIAWLVWLLPVLFS
eukprot:CCRYP_018576-RA/>CCRYP_018576-RA protein AED:0.62 eAED:1.00 QI:0/-1/0/1/-1/0/1/0/87